MTVFGGDVVMSRRRRNGRFALAPFFAMRGPGPAHRRWRAAIFPGRFDEEVDRARCAGGSSPMRMRGG